MSQCQTAGEPCTGHHECCTGICVDPGTGVDACQAVTGCRPIGEVCTDSSDCCSADCQAEAGATVKRCLKPGGCMASGEVCWQGQSTNCCPSGPDGGNQLCDMTVLGVLRCYGVGTMAQCLADGQPCTFADECCSGFCLPDASGNLTCGAACVPITGACTADADCCDGVCIGGVCTPSSHGCVPLGGQCTQSSECCSGACDTGSGVCTIS
jgi:hypothetical protein